MIEKKTEYYSIDYWDDMSYNFHELCAGDDLEALKRMYQHIREKDPAMKVKLSKITHIEIDKAETILSEL